MTGMLRRRMYSSRAQQLLQQSQKVEVPLFGGHAHFVLTPVVAAAAVKRFSILTKERFRTGSVDLLAQRFLPTWQASEQICDIPRLAAFHQIEQVQDISQTVAPASNRCVKK